jgi:hypothetical protein
MSYAAGFAVGERQAYDARSAGVVLEPPQGIATTDWERGRRDSLFARSPEWASRKPCSATSNAVARPADDWEI